LADREEGGFGLLIVAGYVYFTCPLAAGTDAFLLLKNFRPQ
jgi:hypothetical protein